MAIRWKINDKSSILFGWFEIIYKKLWYVWRTFKDWKVSAIIYALHIGYIDVQSTPSIEESLLITRI